MKDNDILNILAAVIMLFSSVGVALAQYPVPEEALVIVATDSRYTQPIERLTPLPEGMSETQWRPYPLPGYQISHLSIAQGALTSNAPPANAPPVRTKVTDLEQTRHYVYLRYQNVVQVQLKGVQDELVQYTPEDADGVVTASPDKLSYPGYEVQRLRRFADSYASPGRSAGPAVSCGDCCRAGSGARATIPCRPGPGQSADR